MTIEEAIKRTIEGGYNNGLEILAALELGQRMNLECVVFLDKDFWIALGKAMRWRVCPENECDGSGTVTIPISNPNWPTPPTTTAPCTCKIRGDRQPVWKEQWHKFIDILAEGKTASDYFKTL